MSFIEAFQAVMNRNEGCIALGISMKYYECLNHPPLSVVHMLAEEGNIPTSILEIKSNPHVHHVSLEKHIVGCAEQRQTIATLRRNTNQATMLLWIICSC